MPKDSNGEKIPGEGADLLDPLAEGPAAGRPRRAATSFNPSQKMVQVLIGFGSNQGDPLQICREAIESLRRHPGIRVLKISSFYRTEPVGMTQQDWFINGVIQAETMLGAKQLLQALHGIERRYGRVRQEGQERWGPRTLDLDVLAYGGQVIDLPGLKIPHPRLHERRFVLEPLVEIAPQWVHPVFKESAATLLHRLPRQKRGQEVQKLENE